VSDLSMYLAFVEGDVALSTVKHPPNRPGCHCHLSDLSLYEHFIKGRL
jgi:hypothetical protein